MARIGVIADDLTGANDTGLQFSKVGLGTNIEWNVARIENLQNTDVCVIDTESRRDTPEVAYRKVFEAAMRLKRSGVKLFYKKVDSTLRGNLGSELDGIMDALGSSLALVAPSFPKNRRITVGGHQLVDSLPLEHTEISNDAIVPVKTSHIPTIIGSQSRRRVYQIPLVDVLQGVESIRARIEQELRRGIEILVFDSTTQMELRAIAQAAALLKETPILCGSAGLAEEIPYAFDLQSIRNGILIIAGTLSSVTSSQIEMLEKTMQVEVIEIKPEELTSEGEEKINIKSICAAAKKRLNDGEVVVIRLAKPNQREEKIKHLDGAMGQSEISLIDALGNIAQRLVDDALAGLILTGGDTAFSVMRSLEVEGIRIIGEVEPGVPIVATIGGKIEGLKMVTKAGAFGGDQTLIRAVERLRWGV